MDFADTIIMCSKKDYKKIIVPILVESIYCDRRPERSHKSFHCLSFTYLKSLIDGGWALPWVSRTSLTFLSQPESDEPFLTGQGNPRALLQMPQCDFLLIPAPEKWKVKVKPTFWIFLLMPWIYVSVNQIVN